ncbi:MAG TPA: alpha-2-macroglobulin family protein, partial [Alphaproteobacteria bacterium]|nr:alpha-2-macroglobulin family protein [Alphaproteobacteria bacterium]
NEAGQWKESLTVPQQAIVHGTLSVEGAVQDDRGKSVASTATATYTGVDRMVGVRSPQWIYEAGKPVALETLVVDDAGAPIADVPVEALVEREVVSIAKVKGAGNAYLNETTVTWEEAARCDTPSTLQPVPCNFTPQHGGTYRLTAAIADTKGRPHKSVVGLWVTGSDYVQWNDQNETALPIVPEKNAYAVGETARYLVKNPWPGAKALVTVERYGVIDHFVKTLEGAAPVIEIPVKPDYLPGFYLSVLVFSPRVDVPPPEVGQIDLGKPAFRMGYVTTSVNDPYKDMAVTVKVAREIYRPGETAHIDLHAAPRHPAEGPEPIELAVAVVDEAVFDLIARGKAAYDPYAGFHDLEGLDLANYNLLTRLVGRQKFEKKGANPGGDGGADLGLRSLFKFVSYWNPSLPLDDGGHAAVDVKVPDNLTGWRVLALAVTPGDRMGLGEGGFKVNRPTELRPVMPNQLREGDRFEAGFSVMNRTDRPRTIRVEIEASGDLKDGKPLSRAQNVTLAAYQRTNVFLPLETGYLPLDRARPEGSISFKATAADESDSDALTHTIPVLKSRIFDVGALYGSTVETTLSQTVSFPPDIHTDAGDLTVTLSPSVLGNLEGAFRYVRDYPYPCWEQLLTRGVMAARFQTLKPWLAPAFSWTDSKDLPAQMLARAAEFQAPGGGMAYFTPDDAYADPYLSAYTALAFAWLRADGYEVPQAVESRLTDYLLTFLRKDVAPDFYQEGMTSSVRAVALAALAQGGKLSATDLSRYRTHAARMDLFGKAHLLMAALSPLQGTNPDPAIARELAGQILSAGNESAGKLVFNQTYDDGYARILASPLRDNCAIVSALVRYAATPEGKTLVGDKAMRAARAVTQSRGSRDHWENTQENVFCLNALTDYARANETQAPDMTVRAALASAPFGEASFRAFTDPPVSLIRPVGPDDPGRTAPLTLKREGQGRLYYAARLRTAPKTPDASPVNAGMDLRREVSRREGSNWTLLAEGAPVTRGQTLRVDLFLSVPTARNFVVVDDPVPSGLEPVNRDLATASGVDADEGAFEPAGGSFWFKYADWKEYGFSRWSFYHQELRHDAARFYADYLPPGNYHLSYVVQAVAEGTFAALPARAEEMYDPDIYARSGAGTLRVVSAPKENRGQSP